MKTHGRYFFALWPSEPVRQAISTAARELPSLGRPVPEQNYHITLAFMGDLSRDKLPELLAVGDAVPAPCGELILDVFDAFRSARVMFAGPSHVPTWLQEFRALLVDSLSDAGYIPDRAGEFHPHVTLRRKLPAEWPELPVGPKNAVHWPVSGYVLMESPLTSGLPYYSLLHSWSHGQIASTA